MTAIASSKSDTTTSSGAHTENRALNVVTWVVQALLGALFLFAGIMKFVTPIEEMTKNMPLPAAFLYFIGAYEALGGLGLILPGALKIRRGLTPVAAIGLAIIMAGAVVVSFKTNPAMAAVPLVVGVLAGFVAKRRWSWLAG